MRDKEEKEEGGRKKDVSVGDLTECRAFLCVCVIQSKLSQGHIETCKLKISRTGVYICCASASVCMSHNVGCTILPLCHTNTRMHAWVSLNRAAALK